MDKINQKYNKNFEMIFDVILVILIMILIIFFTKMTNDYAATNKVEENTRILEDNG
tara:strand:+ start:25583 stop:25750 length:168 start_codon:yes stop_codon:yes gene_type:complete